MGRSRKIAGRRCPNHNYRSRCQYHIILNKAAGVGDFSQIVGCIGSHHNPPFTKLNPSGRIITEAFSKLKELFPFIWIRRRCIMPDHVHFLIFVREESQFHLGDIIRTFKTICSNLIKEEYDIPDTHLFSDGYYDVIVRKKNQLKRMLDYISDNPRRWLVRKQFPGWFHRHEVQIEENFYDAYGNWDLLQESELEAVAISSRDSDAELRKKKVCWLNTVRNDGILVSPFISENEKKVRDWAIENDGAIILLRAEPFGEIYKPAGRYFDLCSEGRLLEIVVPVEGEEEEYLRKHGKPPRGACLRMNELARRIAEGKARSARY